MRREISVWLYIGALLALYGALLTAAGIYQIAHPPAIVLAQYHATLWAGAILLVVGTVYLVSYWPRRSPKL